MRGFTTFVSGSGPSGCYLTLLGWPRSWTITDVSKLIWSDGWTAGWTDWAIFSFHIVFNKKMINRLLGLLGWHMTDKPLEWLIDIFFFSQWPFSSVRMLHNENGSIDCFICYQHNYLRNIQCNKFIKMYFNMSYNETRMNILQGSRCSFGQKLGTFFFYYFLYFLHFLF